MSALIVGAVVYFAGAMCLVAASLRRGPDVSYHDLGWRGFLQRCDDYSPTGWRVLKSGATLIAVGFAIMVAWIVADISSFVRL